jgi:hypothetical protein
VIDGKIQKRHGHRIEPDGIVLRTNRESLRLFVELPKDVQERFHYNAAVAAAYSHKVPDEAALVTGRGQPVEIISHGAQVSTTPRAAV